MIFKNMSPKKLRRSLYAIVVVALVATLFVLPREDRILRALGIKNVEPRVKLGLDLEGGTSLSYDADLSQTPAADRAKAMEGVINVITKRVNPTGTSEAVIQQSGESRIIVELPGVTDAQAAAEQIGRTAQRSSVRQSLPNCGCNSEKDRSSTNHRIVGAASLCSHSIMT